MKPVLALLALVLSSLAFAQIGGGSATFGQGRTRLQDAKASEAAKRTMFEDKDGRYLEAAVLMNIDADEYVAYYAVNEDGETLDAARQTVDGKVEQLRAAFAVLGAGGSDIGVDFIAQNRVYGYVAEGAQFLREVVVGYQVRKNVSVRFRDKLLLESLTKAASVAGVFDLVKVDYVIADSQAIQTKLLETAAEVLRRKADDHARLFGIRTGKYRHLYPPQFGTYFPAELYDQYLAEDSEVVRAWETGKYVIAARKPRTFYYNGLSAKDYDTVVNLLNTEPTVQCTVYVRVRI